jgi:hypothetical protein
MSDESRIVSLDDAVEAVNSVADGFDAERQRLLARIDEQSNLMFQLCGTLQTLLDECQAIAIDLKAYWAKQTDGNDIWPLFMRLRTTIDKAKESQR